MKLGRRPLTEDCEFEPLGGVWLRRLCLTACLLFSAFFFVKSVPGSPLRSHPSKSQLAQASNPLDGVYSSASTPRDPEVRQVGRFLVRPKNIEDVRPGDKVLAQNPETGELAAKRVAQTFRRVTDHLRILEIKNADGTTQTIETTDEHPFWVAGHVWVNASDLAIGDTLTQSDGQPGNVASTRRDERPEGVPVYNFEVADLHNYFVAASPRAPPVLVHNSCGIALGVREGLEEFAENVGAQSWRKWGGDDFVYNFMDVMNDSTKKIHFNLTLPGGKQIDHWSAVLEGSRGLSRSRATSWELAQIYQNPQWWDRITWWHNSQMVANPFLP